VGGPVAKLSSLMSSVVEEMTSSPTSSQSSVTSSDDVLGPGDDENDTNDYVFRIVYMSRPDYVGELHFGYSSFSPNYSSIISSDFENNISICHKFTTKFV